MLVRILIPLMVADINAEKKLIYSYGSGYYFKSTISFLTKADESKFISY